MQKHLNRSNSEKAKTIDNQKIINLKLIKNKIKNLNLNLLPPEKN